VSGTGGFCTDLISSTHQKLIGKIGAEGIYCIALKEQGLGIALKMEDGNMQRLPVVVMSILDQLEVLTEEEKNTLSDYRITKNKNDLGKEVGNLQPVFRLMEA
jgi:L-asparaginase II